MTTPTEQLQLLGLNKYEAEAYYTLLKYGPLTGYEVGKHSQVPLSRSYDILERLVEKGLALVQPGEPVRYNAREPQHFLQQVRSTMEETLGELARTLTTLSPESGANEFWIVHGRKNVLDRSRELIAAAHNQLELSIPANCTTALANELQQAHERGVHIVQLAHQTILAPENIVMVRDESEALLGALAPAETCQAVVSSHRTFVAVLSGYFENLHGVQFIPAPVTPGASAQDVEWMDWETRKHARLRTLSGRHRVA